MINKKIRSTIFFLAVSILFIFSHSVFCAVPVPDGPYTIAATVVPVDETNRSRSGDEVYIASFEYNESWRGYLKKYELACFDTDDGIEKCDSEWAAGELLKESMPGPHSMDVPILENADKYHEFRNIYTYRGKSGGTLDAFNRTNIKTGDLGLEVGDVGTRDKVINYMYGYTYNTDSEGTPQKKRDWILGDIIHSEPEIIDYFDSDGDLTHRYIAVGSNDGMLHFFASSTGEEVFAFIPEDLLTELNDMINSGTHKYMVDGSPNLFSSGTSDEKILIFGERRGGRSYWALDITNPDPEKWTVKWHISGGSGGISTPVTKQINELGYTWSKPYFTKIKTGTDSYEQVAIFSGGYDEIEDGFPEALGASESYTDTVGGTPSVYDKYNPGTDNYGRGIFVRKISDGSELFSVIYSPTTDKLIGNEQTSTDMKYCFPADISILPFSESNLLMYAADIYGQIWKIKYDYYADTTNPFDSNLSTRWTVKRIFASNPGSSLDSGIGAALILPFTDSDPDTPTLDDTDQGRKTFYSPEVSYFGNKWTRNPVLYFGTGDRAHPGYTMISNRFYTVEDTDSLIDETNLLNLTCNELDVNADTDNDGAASDAAEDASIRNDLKSLFYNKKVNGFYRILDEQGNCKDGLSVDHTGEDILSQPILFASIVYFTSYQPPFPGNPSGNVFVYALDYSFGTSVLNYYDSDDPDDYDMGTIEDTFFKISDSSISSGVKIISRDGNAAGFISAGGKVSGVAEGQSMEIPEPSGGVTQMLWEVE